MFVLSIKAHRLMIFLVLSSSSCHPVERFELWRENVWVETFLWAYCSCKTCRSALCNPARCAIVYEAFCPTSTHQLVLFLSSSSVLLLYSHQCTGLCQRMRVTFEWRFTTEPQLKCFLWYEKNATSSTQRINATQSQANLQIIENCAVVRFLTVAEHVNSMHN